MIDLETMGDTASSAATSSLVSEGETLDIAVAAEERIGSSSDSTGVRAGQRRRECVDRQEEGRRSGRTWNDEAVERERIVEVVAAASIVDSVEAAERRPARFATLARRVGTARRFSDRVVERIRSDSRSSLVVRWRILATRHEAE